MSTRVPFPGGSEALATSEDRLLGGRVTLRQPLKGYRAGLDAALLAASCEARTGERVIDVGCGAGAVMLAAAARRPGARFTGLERDPDLAALARQNLDLNVQAGGAIVEGDVGAGFKPLGLAPFDAALCNPPFFDNPAALRGPAPEKRGAWVADDGLQAWLVFLVKSVREGGQIVVIHRADALAQILAGLSPKAGSFQIRPVHPYADEPAKRVLVRAIKTGKAPLQILPPLVLHGRDGAKHTAAVEAILRGEAALGWA